MEVDRSGLEKGTNEVRPDCVPNGKRLFATRESDLILKVNRIPRTCDSPSATPLGMLADSCITACGF